MFFFQAEDGIRDLTVTGVQTCALPISPFQFQIRLMAVHRPLGEQAQHDQVRRRQRRLSPRGNTSSFADSSGGANSMRQVQLQEFSLLPRPSTRSGFKISLLLESADGKRQVL